MHGLRISVRYKHGSKRQWNHTAAEVLQRLRFTVHSFLKKTKKQKKDQTPRRNPTKNRRLHCRTTHCSFLPDSRNQYTITSHDHKQLIKTMKTHATELAYTHGELAVRILVDCRCTAGRPPSSTSISLITRWINDDAGSMHWPLTSAWAAGRLFGCVGCNHAQRDGVWGGRERLSDQRRRSEAVEEGALTLNGQAQGGHHGQLINHVFFSEKLGTALLSSCADTS